jgi:hypothetical protein
MVLSKGLRLLATVSLLMSMLMMMPGMLLGFERSVGCLKPLSWKRVLTAVAYPRRVDNQRTFLL